MTTLTYHSNPALKARLVADARAHRDADRYLQGTYLALTGDDWRGCAVGCTTVPLVAEARDIALYDVRGLFIAWHAEQETHAGIPAWLGHVEDAIFEALPVALARDWPLRLLTAIPVGVDLTGVREQWLRDIVLDPQRGALAHAATALDAAGLGEHAARLRVVARDADWGAARAIARTARDAAWAAGAFAGAAETAAWAAGDAARTAGASAWAAGDVARIAGASAGEDWAVASNAAWQWMADRLITRLTEEQDA